MSFNPGCCLDVIAGQRQNGGGAAQWNCVYEVDWRDAFVSLGAVDLDSPGASFTFEGITWTTPSIANTGVDQSAALTSWSLTSSGLEVVGATGSFVADGPTAQHIFASLFDIAANTATPFEADPTRKYLVQCYVSETDANANLRESGCGIYKVSGGAGAIPGGFWTSFCTFGFNGGVADIPSYSAGNTGAPARFNRIDLTAEAHNVPTLHYDGSGHLIDGYAAPFGTTWPDNDEFRAVASASDSAEVENDVPGDPIGGFRVVFMHAGLGLNAVIQQSRICQF